MAGAPSESNAVLKRSIGHHELRSQLARGGEVEALRLADLVDVSGGLLLFGLDRRWLRALNRSVPRRGLVGE